MRACYTRYNRHRHVFKWNPLPNPQRLPSRLRPSPGLNPNPNPYITNISPSSLKRRCGRPYTRPLPSRGAALSRGRSPVASCRYRELGLALPVKRIFMPTSDVKFVNQRRAELDGYMQVRVRVLPRRAHHMHARCVHVTRRRRTKTET